MPLDHLVDTFNLRFRDLGLENAALRFDGQAVHGEFEGHRFTSQFRAIRRGQNLGPPYGYDAFPHAEAVNASGIWALEGSMAPLRVIGLDRLVRTVHMLNFLLLDADEAVLFLEVHAQHLLAVERDHGAFFEDVIHRCGASLQRMVIGLSLPPERHQNFPILLKRLSNYRDRGYATALRLTSSSDGRCWKALDDILTPQTAPDCLRLHASLISGLCEGHQQAERLKRPIRIRGCPNLLLGISDIETAADFERAITLGADLFDGTWLEASRQ